MIKGFWHIALMGNWYSIVHNQLRTMINSGLYAECSEIKIGCCGSVLELDYLNHLILSKYDKLKLCAHEKSLKCYEYPTLRLINDDNDVYNGFYIHTKGASKPNDTLTAHWGAWLNEAILNRWQEYYVNLETYDVAGVNWLGSENKGYYSGNFFWFRSEVVQNLQPFDKLNKANRYEAEHWITSGNHKYFKGEFKECGLGKDTFKIKLI